MSRREQSHAYTRPRARAIVVFDAQQHAPADRARDTPDAGGVQDVAEMEPAGRRPRSKRNGTRAASAKGGYLCSVHCDDREWARRAQEILETTGAKNLVSTAEAAADYHP